MLGDLGVDLPTVLGAVLGTSPTLLSTTPTMPGTMLGAGSMLGTDLGADLPTVLGAVLGTSPTLSGTTPTMLGPMLGDFNEELW